MNIELNRLKQAMTAQLHRNDIAANNLANTKTTGYKRDVVFMDVLEEKSYNSIKVSLHSDLKQGTMEETANPLDLAISGQGLFVLDMDGENVYTRDGHFTLNQDGLLVSNNGYHVMGQNGPINLTANGLVTGAISIAQDGQMFLDEVPVDVIKIVNISNPETLVKTTDNAFKISSDTLLENNNNPTIHQGNLEGSNVDPVSEMINLIELQRQFESIQRTIRTLDDALGNAANKVGSYR
ncbi:MAG: flagellar basal-body rod protein FlgF [Candidatus Marinimicrobia bacterium]|nr:flagellar basal-body rod protein FlgF [Candidatus Neomarinimicrobiota bacterium]